MTTFIVVTAAMVAFALAWVLFPLLKPGKPEGVAREALNVAILRDQLGELDADLATGAMPREQYDEARRELERRVLEDSKPVAPVMSAPSRSAAWTATILAGAMPIAALLLYVALGNRDAFAPETTRAARSAAEHEVTPRQVEEMAARLAAKLEQEPDNPEDWVMLARTYYVLNRHAEAARAFERALALGPGNADLLADYADSVAAAQGGLQGKAQELILRALKADPAHLKALALAGAAAFERKDYPRAVAFWERMKATVSPGSSIAGSIDASIAEARQLGGLGTGLPPASAALVAAPAGALAKSPRGGASPAPAMPGAAIAGTVLLAQAFAGKAAPTDTVFIFARAVDGPKMPLAILRKQVKDLPAAFKLDDSMAMTPDFALSRFPAVVVGARVSKSGNAAPQTGDLEGFSPAVKLGTTGLTVIIDRALP